MKRLSNKVKKLEKKLKLEKEYRERVQVKVCANGTPSWCANFDIEHCTDDTCPGWYDHTEECKKVDCFKEGKLDFY